MVKVKKAGKRKVSVNSGIRINDILLKLHWRQVNAQQ